MLSSRAPGRSWPRLLGVLALVLACCSVSTTSEAAWRATSSRPAKAKASAPAKARAETWKDRAAKSRDKSRLTKKPATTRPARKGRAAENRTARSHRTDRGAKPWTARRAPPRRP